MISVASSANTTVADGTHIILAMLIVALVFLGAIGLGELVRFTSHRRAERRSRTS